VKTLAFRRDLYSGFAVDEAAKAFADFCTIEREEEAERWILKLTATGDTDEELLSNELSNYALGATIERRGPES
jgi:hypothetical protein